MKYIKHVDGFTGCYRGLFPRLLCNSVNIVTYKTVSDASSRYASKFFPCLSTDVSDDKVNEADKYV